MSMQRRPFYQLKRFRIALLILFFFEDFFILSKIFFHITMPWYVLIPSTFSLILAFVCVVIDWIKNYHVSKSVVLTTVEISNKYRILQSPILLWITEIRTLCGAFLKRDKISDSAHTYSYYKRDVQSLSVICVLLMALIIGSFIFVHSNFMKIFILIVALYLLLMKLGNFIGYIKNPHYIDSGNLTVKHGYRISIDIPLHEIENITEIQLNKKEKPSPNQGLDKKLTISGRTNIRVSLKREINYEDTLLGYQTVKYLNFYLDDPSQLIYFSQLTLGPEYVS